MAPNHPGGSQASVVLTIIGTVDIAAGRALCQILQTSFDHGGEVVTCDVSRAHVDIGLVDALARLQLTALRAGCTIGIRGGTAELGRLIELAGLAGTVPSGSESG